MVIVIHSCNLIGIFWMCERKTQSTTFSLDMDQNYPSCVQLLVMCNAIEQISTIALLASYSKLTCQPCVEYGLLFEQNIEFFITSLCLHARVPRCATKKGHSYSLPKLFFFAPCNSLSCQRINWKTGISYFNPGNWGCKILQMY